MEHLRRSSGAVFPPRDRHFKGAAAWRHCHLTNIATNVATTTTTNGEGDYTILYLTPGNYTLSVELSGFKKMVRDTIEVRVGDKLAIDATLDVAGWRKRSRSQVRRHCSRRAADRLPSHQREADLDDAALRR